MDKQLYLFFDTETTGLPLDYNAPSTDLYNWPRLVQISWIVSDNNGYIISKDNHIIKPNGFTIPDDVSKLHGITTERALAIGEKVEDILHRFWKDVQNASYIIGHNVNFDENVIEAEFYRMGENNVFLTKHSICTKFVSTDYCKIPNPWNSREYKWPKLSELYFKLFGKDFVDAHNSEADVQATFECFWKLKELGVLSSLELGGKIAPNSNECKSDNKMHYTTFAFNAADYYGYGKPTTDFSERLLGQDWNLFAKGSESQTILFDYANKAHLMNKGKGIRGSYYLKDKNSILLSFGEDSCYLHCVYYNTEIIILRFDQSDEHIALSRKDIVFHSVGEIQNYFTKVRQNIDLKKEEENKRKIIEQENHVKALIEDICRIGVPASDKRVESLKRRHRELSLIIGTEKAAQYQSYIDNAVKENQKEKEERAVAVEYCKRAKEERNAKLLVKIINCAIIIVFVTVWILSICHHFFSEWETCYSILKWSAIISGICIWLLLNFGGVFENFFGAKALTGIFALCTIVLFAIYDYEYRSFGGDKYLSRTVFHLFDGESKRRIRNRINGSYDLYDLNKYLSDNKSGYYVEEAKGQLYYASDQLCRQAETLGDWKYIIDNAPQEYKADAKKNYARLDSVVWDNEELAYKNAKSLGSIEAYEKYLSLEFGDVSHDHEIESLLHKIESFIALEKEFQESMKMERERRQSKKKDF